MTDEPEVEVEVPEGALRPPPILVADDDAELELPVVEEPEPQETP